MMAIFQLVAIPLIFLHVSFNMLFFTWLSVVIILFVMGGLNYFRSIKTVILKRKAIRFNLWFFVAVLLVAIQTAVLVLFMHIDNDDATYVARGVIDLRSNTLYQFNQYAGDMQAAIPWRYILSPWSDFMAMIAKFSRIHPTIIAHTILPAILIPLAYMVLYYIGNNFLFRDKEKTYLFLSITSLLNIFGCYSIRTSSIFMLIRIWQGKAILANVMLPMLMIETYQLLQGERMQYKQLLRLLVVVMASCMVSSMGILFSPIIIIVMVGIGILREKNYQLVIRGGIGVMPVVVYLGIYMIGNYF